MSIKDILKKSVYDQYISANADITVELLLLTLTVALVLCVFLLWVYKFTFRGAVYNSSYAVSLLLTGLVTSLIILPISSNLTLSLGMVGALSIVRYRTAVKDPRDIAYMFWAICIGLTCGAGFFLVAVSGCAFIGIAMIVSFMIQGKIISGDPCIAVIRLEPETSVDELKEKFKKIEIKSIVYTDKYIEVTSELADIPDENTLSSLKEYSKITSMSFVKYNGDFAL